MSSELDTEINEVVDEVSDHILGIIGIVKTANHLLEDAATALNYFKQSKEVDDASDVISFLDQAELLLDSIGTKFSPKVETLSTTIDSVRHQIELNNKESK